jgi:hypothetical protein
VKKEEKEIEKNRTGSAVAPMWVDGSAEVDVAPPVSPAHCLSIERDLLMQARDDRDIFQTSPHDLPAINIHSL